MSRQWKPGDVAIAFDQNWEFRVVRHHGAPDYWSAADGTWPTGVSADLLDYRPLVVIDPEDREQVERLLSLYGAEVRRDNGDLDDAMQAALRSLVTDPKPEEPTGLGAVVEDADGLRWLRMAGISGAEYTPWASANKDRQRFDRKWADIAAVKVLSEGVTS